MVKRDQQSDSPRLQGSPFAIGKGKINERFIATHSFPSCRPTMWCMLGHVLCVIQTAQHVDDVPVEKFHQPAAALPPCDKLAKNTLHFMGIVVSSATNRTVLDACMSAVGHAVRRHNRKPGRPALPCV